MTSEIYDGILPKGWTGGEASTKWYKGKLIHLYRLTRKCAQCGNEMRIDVTKQALEGTAKNAGLHLKRCSVCRARAKGERTSSRPRVEGEPSPRDLAKQQAFTEEAATIIATLKAEVTGLYALNKELRQRLAKYEPQEQQFPWGG